ncbi:MAG TPA: PAS domain-containing sensor histidine kinase [Stellaceae bacterium]|nr:PAS domain-containing sensor histidine kinase [Stellaceae bacterium]
MSPGKLRAYHPDGLNNAPIRLPAAPSAHAGGAAALAPFLTPLLAQLPPFHLADRSGAALYASPAHDALAKRLGGPSSLLPTAEIVAELESGGATVLHELSFGTAPAIHLRARYSGIRGADGVLECVLGVIEETSELHAARHQLSLTNDRLEDITRLASDWIWETDRDLRLTFVSPRVTEVLGFQPVELVGRPFLALGQFAGDESPLDPARRTPFRDIPFTMRHSNGSERLFHIASLPVFCPASGEFLGFRGSARDVTEQNEARQRAAQSQSQLTQAIESISEGFALFDAEDRLVLSNRKFVNLFPGAESAIRPRARFADIMRAVVDAGAIAVPPSEREAWLAERLRLRAAPRASFEVALSDKRWIRVSDHRTADGSTVGIRTDITDLKHREEALYAAKEAAEIASRSKSEFLANISHELRTPLNAIIGFSEIMREQIFGPIGSPQYLEYVGDVLDSAHHLLEVINDILDIAKAEAGKLELSEDEVDIVAIMRSATRLVQERAQRGEVAIHLRLPDDLPPLLADERKLKQILLNLLTNAVKFTPAGGSIEVTARLDGNGDLLVSVADTGIGIAAEDIATALAPFGQVDSKLNRKYEGTGLGLPLCNAMAKLHGGALAIDSVVGHGTTVTVRLPASRVRQPA